MIYCPYCKKKLLSKSNCYECKHKKVNIKIFLNGFERPFEKFSGISMIVTVPNNKKYEIYMYLCSDNHKMTAVYLLPSFLSSSPKYYGKHIIIREGFLFDYGELSYDKIVSKLNMVLNFQ